MLDFKRERVLFGIRRLLINLDFFMVKFGGEGVIDQKETEDVALSGLPTNIQDWFNEASEEIGSGLNGVKRIWQKFPEEEINKFFSSKVSDSQKKELAETLLKVAGSSVEDNRRDGAYLLGADFLLDERRNVALLAAKNKLEIPYGEYFDEMDKDTRFINDPNVGRKWAEDEKRLTQEARMKVEVLFNSKKEKIGKGFAFEETPQGTAVFFNGNLVGVFKGAEFSEKPSNKDIIVWKQRELVDMYKFQDRKTAQMRERIYAWGEGWDEPENIFQDADVESNRSINMTAPTISVDGKIWFQVDGKPKEIDLYDR